MIINHNMMSMNAQRSLGVNSSGLEKSIEKLVIFIGKYFLTNI